MYLHILKKKKRNLYAEKKNKIMINFWAKLHYRKTKSKNNFGHRNKNN